MKQSEAKKPRGVYIYIDGFNLYHRCLETNPALKWLCFRRLFSKFILPNNPILGIKFFTAKIDPYSDKETAGQRRQKAYWDALESADVEIILGRLEARKRQCKSDCQGNYYTMSEKMSDVSMALHIYRDFQRGLIPKLDADGKEIAGQLYNPNIVCAMSADLDVVPALRMVRDLDSKCDIRVIVPSFDQDMLWSRAADFNFVRLTKLEPEWLQKSQFPNPCVGKIGQNIAKPDTWT